tara:strand:+ start:242 stop:925 length:684 start_codon:yes stop_codon:yes gene_type:complete
MATLGSNPDYQYQFKLLRDELEELEMGKAKKKQAGLTIGKNLIDIYSGTQNLKTKELMATGLFDLNPEYMQAGMFERFFTPASERVVVNSLLKEGSPELTKAKSLISNESNVANSYSKIDNFMSNPIMPGQETTSASKVVGAGMPELTTTTTSKAGLGGMTFGQATGALGFGASLYDMYQNFDKKSEVDKGLSVGKTALAGMSLIPGLNVIGGIGSLALTGLDVIFD